jgi:hypothetical protein
VEGSLYILPVLDKRQGERGHGGFSFSFIGSARMFGSDRGFIVIVLGEDDGPSHVIRHFFG